MTTKPRNRLTVSKIVSIGATVEGDDPEAVITLWKAKPLTAADARRQLKAYRIEMQRKRPAMSRKDVEAAVLRAHPEIAAAALTKTAPTAGGKGPLGSGSARPVAEWGPVVEKVALARLDEQRQAISKIRETQKQNGETMTPRKAEIAPADTIRGKVDKIALEMVAKGEAENLTQARPLVWKSRPDLVEASRAEPGRVPGIYGGRAPAADTVPERIGKAVHARADEMAGIPQFWNETDAERRVRVWKSPQGRKLREAYTDAMKRGDAKFEKANAHPAAMRILKSWEADPAEGLR